jgi:hypothetical protein
MHWKIVRKKYDIDKHYKEKKIDNKVLISVTKYQCQKKKKKTINLGNFEFEVKQYMYSKILYHNRLS